MMIDLSYALTDGMPTFVGDDETHLIKTKDYATDKYVAYKLTTGMHAGTHVDVPMHFGGDKYVCDYPIDSFAGKGVAIDSRNKVLTEYHSKYDSIIGQGDCVIIVTEFCDMYADPKKYYSSYPTVDIEFAKVLVSKKVKLLALDTPSPDRVPFAVHKLLLSNGILIVENLRNTKALLGKRFNFYCVPPAVKAEASICRAFAVI